MRKPYVFFYGGYMNPEVLASVGVEVSAFEKASVDGFALTVGPIANLKEQEGAVAYGMLTRLTHRELNKLYGEQPSHLKGALYEAEAVIATRSDGGQVAAMTYICDELPPAKADSAYLAKLVEAAEALDLPADYISHIRSFAP